MSPVGLSRPRAHGAALLASGAPSAVARTARDVADLSDRERQLRRFEQALRQTVTAIVLAVAEGLIRTDQLEPGREGPVSTARLFSEGFRAITDNGVLGDPQHATAEAGEAILDRITAAYVERIEAER